MEKAPELTIWIHKKTGLERRLNAFTVRKLGKSLTDNYYQVEQPTRPKENPPEVQALLNAAKKVKCCDKEGCECKDNVCIPTTPEPIPESEAIEPETFEATDEPEAEYKPALTPKNKGGRPKSKRK